MFLKIQNLAENHLKAKRDYTRRLHPSIHSISSHLLSICYVLLNVAIAQSSRAMLGFHCAPFSLNSADINQAFEFHAEWGKSQFYKGKAAGAGKNEQAEGLLCRLPAQSGVQTKARVEKRSKLSQRLSAPTGNVPVEGLGREPQDALLPGRRQRRSREPSHHIKVPG